MKTVSEVVIKVSALMMGLPDKVGGNVVEKKAFVEVLSKMGIQFYAVQLDFKIHHFQKRFDFYSAQTE